MPISYWFLQLNFYQRSIKITDDMTLPNVEKTANFSGFARTTSYIGIMAKLESVNSN